MKQPETPQIRSQNRAKPTGSNDLEPMPNNIFFVKTTIGLIFGENFGEKIVLCPPLVYDMQQW